MAATTRKPRSFASSTGAAVVPGVVSPLPGAGEELLLGEDSVEVEIEAALHVALEHLHRDDERAARVGEAAGERQLDRVPLGVVVELAEEDHVRRGEVRHGLLQPDGTQRRGLHQARLTSRAGRLEARRVEAQVNGAESDRRGSGREPATAPTRRGSPSP